MWRCVVGLLWVALAGCSSINSAPMAAGAASGAGNGLAYYLPRKDLVITVKVPDPSASAPTVVEITTTGSFPDLSRAYMLQYKRNPIGKNLLNVGVTAAGLLNSTVKSTSTSQLSDVFSAYSDLAKIEGRWRERKPEDDCTAAGDHRYTIDFRHGLKHKGGRLVPKQEICGDRVQVEVRRLWLATEPGAQLSASDCPASSCSGVYYRQNRPYLVIATANGVSASQLVESPSESNTLFLPIAATVFANNDATLTFVDGVPTAYNQDTDGEAVALLKLPAQILKAYFEAVGGVLSAMKENKNAETEKLGAEMKLEIAKRQFAVCLAALQAGKTPDELKTLGCGQ